MDIRRHASRDGFFKRMIQGEKWVKHHFEEKEVKIIRGTQQNEVISTKIGIPDYYLPECNTFIEEKKFLQTKLSPGQFELCLYLNSIEYPVFIAIRASGSIMPLNEYLKYVKWPKKWSI